MKSKKIINSIIIIFSLLILFLSVYGPEKLANYKDRDILDKVHAEVIEEAGEGYRYTLNPNEKLCILSRCLSSQILPETELNALRRTETEGYDYNNLDGAYAFVVNHRGPTGKEITDKEIYESCNDGLKALVEMEILPKEIKEVEALLYDAVLYSAIDVLEPRNNVSVWKVSMSNNQKNANKQNRLIDVYIDADNGKIYEFYVRTDWTWEDIDTDFIIEKWSEYMGLGLPKLYESDNPLLETTPYFKKYIFDGMGEDKTIVTIGFYEGINELYLKIS